MSYYVKDKNDFENKLTEIGDQALVVVEFYATWCGPCKQLMPKVELLPQEFPDIHVLKIDVDECEELTVDYSIQAMPTFVFIKKNQTLESFTGANIEQVKKLINKYNKKK
ncbi:Thioredoxin-2 [Blattella germanica]|nr:Thioredoxin-2 [Blattella germanica]